MINTDMKYHTYYRYSEPNAYGQRQLSDTPQGEVKMAINISTQQIKDNIKYREATFIGLTHDKQINDTYVVEYEGARLKVLYVNPKGKLRQVFMVEV